MNKFQSLFLGATMAAATATVVSFAPSAALAIQLYGNISIRGDANLGPNNQTPANTAITWTNASGTVSNNSNGSFFDLRNTTATLQNIALTIADLANVSNTAPSSAVYNFGAIDNFANFGNVTLDGINGLLAFHLDPGSLTRTVLGNDTVVVTLDQVTGRFDFNGTTFATAVMSGEQSGSSGTFGISATAVPEPLTMTGLALGVGFGGFLKTRYSKKEKQLEKV